VHNNKEKIEMKLTRQVVEGFIVRGYITRFREELFWPARLVAMPESYIPQDADAIPHYRKGSDGRFHEYYGWEPSNAANQVYLPEAFAPDNIGTSIDLLIRKAGNLRFRLRRWTKAKWEHVWLGVVTEKVVGTENGVVSEIEFRGRNGTLVGYWAHGHFDPKLPYQG
jgi:hypothetical protein